MVTTRASANANKEKPASPKEAGDKHQTQHASPQPKRQKVDKQATLEETVRLENGKENHPRKNSEPREEQLSPTTQSSKTNGSAVKPSEEPNVPSNILEKGIIYFFFRGRIGIDDPSSVDDIARSYILLRPISVDAKLGEGPIGDAGNTRLIALPKKVLPSSGTDRFMVFVEKSSASFQELKKTFLAAEDYETKTAGTRHTPAATPAGEGVYAITTTGRESHLAYKSTLPETIGKVQQSLGFKEQGSFIISTKNPQYAGPPIARLPQGPDYPKEMLDSFRALRWVPSRPEHLNYANAQLLLIGESSGLTKATEPQDKDKEEGKEDPGKVLDHLEEEDLRRMRHLPGGQSASVYTDLEARAKDYPKIQTTF